ncbi:Glycosyltransferase [Flavobacterium beibuense]|uniref:Glycosyltransferase n=2 Tax=Flavobacterium beibuense TaxID=657326 RepID=A0A444WI88_9FLAO|nr:Glycosyltransferase [Flavobacterium beibuense]
MGGIENMLLASIKSYKTKNIDIYIISNLGGGLDHEFVKKGITLIDLKGTNPFKQFFRLFYILKIEKFDIVHSQYSHNSGFLALASYLRKVPFFISVHNQKAVFKLSWENKFFLSTLRSLYLNIHKKLSLDFSSLIVGHSEVNLDYYSRKWRGNQKFFAVKNGIDFSNLNEQANSNNENNVAFKNFIYNASKVFIHIGSFKDQKNHSFLIDLFEKLEPKKNNYKLVLLGSGNLLGAIQDKVKNRGLEDFVFFAGMQKEIGFYLEKSDIFLFPSLYEGFGNVLIEAQYMKIPVCASQITPHYEAVYKGYHKYFFDPKDLNDAFIKTNKLIEDYDKCSLGTMIDKACYFSANFSVENMVNEIVLKYKARKREFNEG